MSLFDLGSSRIRSGNREQTTTRERCAKGEHAGPKKTSDTGEYDEGGRETGWWFLPYKLVLVLFLVGRGCGFSCCLVLVVVPAMVAVVLVLMVVSCCRSRDTAAPEDFQEFTKIGGDGKPVREQGIKQLSRQLVGRVGEKGG